MAFTAESPSGKGQVVFKVVPVPGAAILQVTMDQLLCAFLSHTHYWYEGDRLIEGRIMYICMYVCVIITYGC